MEKFSAHPGLWRYPGWRYAGWLEAEGGFLLLSVSRPVSSRGRRPGGLPGRSDRGYISKIVALVEPNDGSAIPLLGLENPKVIGERRFAPRAPILTEKRFEELKALDPHCWHRALGLRINPRPSPT